MNIANIVTILSSLSPLAVVLYLAYEKYQSGSSDLATKIKQEYKERNDQLEQRIKDLEDEHHEHSVQIGKLEAVLEEKEKQIVKYETIFANRNPELNTILEEIRTFMRDIHNQNKYQTDILEKRQERDKTIDEASLRHTGEPIRVPRPFKK